MDAKSHCNEIIPSVVAFKRVRLAPKQLHPSVARSTSVFPRICIFTNGICTLTHSVPHFAHVLRYIVG
jgi:hypothetical protein